MPNDYLIEYLPFSHSLSKSASEKTSLGSYQTCQQIMDTIYKEDPSKWPYGLDIPGHDGGVYLIRKSASSQPVGFVGWQERRKGHKKVGYYSIGILPEYRGSGFAKEAVQQVISEKSAGVDEVRALIIHTNTASKALAGSLGIPVEEL
jgi:RimJ/RimL family protein N-acetyltransferase